MKVSDATPEIIGAAPPIAAVVDSGTPETGPPIRAADVTREPMVEGSARGSELVGHEELLFREIQHRIVNSLQIIASMIAIKARTVQSDEARVHLEDVRQRVISVANLQRHLHLADAGRSVEMAPYLSQLCESLTESMIESPGPISLVVRSAATLLPTKKAESVGLIVTELVINSLKHAFPDGRRGEIRVAYEAEGPDWRLSVSDNGIGRQDDDREHAYVGIGTRIVAMLARELDARVDISSGPEGTTVSVVHAGAGPGETTETAV